MIRRRGAPQEESSDDEEDDMFSNLPNSAHSTTTDNSTTSAAAPSNDNSLARDSLPILPSITSSMKRHHVVMSNTRKEQMDALIHELETDKSSAHSTQRTARFRA